MTRKIDNEQRKKFDKKIDKLIRAGGVPLEVLNAGYRDRIWKQFKAEEEEAAAAKGSADAGASRGADRQILSIDDVIRTRWLGGRGITQYIKGGREEWE